MATPEARTETRNSAIVNLNKLRDHDVARFVGKDRLGPLSFEEFVPELQAAAALAGALGDAIRSGAEYPHVVYGQISGSIHEINQQLTRAENLTITEAPNARASIGRDVEQVVAKFVRDWWPIVYAAERSDPQRVQDDLATIREEVHGARSELADARREMESLSTAAKEGAKNVVEERTKTVNEELKAKAAEIDLIIANARKLSGFVAAGKEATHFKGLADAHQKAGRAWFLATIALAAILVGTVYRLSSSHWPLSEDPKAGVATIEIVRFVAARVAFVTIALLAITQATRNYRAHRHNEVVNRHREKALETFTVFADAGVQPHIRDAVLMQASTAVFTAHPTGYLGPEGDVISQATIIDAIKLAQSPPAQRPPGV